MANKMYLVTPEQFNMQQTPASNPYSDKLRDLEQQLRQILDNNLLDEHKKMVLYNQLLLQFLNTKEEEKESKKIRLEIPAPLPFDAPPPLPFDEDLMPPPPPPPPPTAYKSTPQDEQLKKQLIYNEMIATTPATDKKKLQKLISSLQPLGLGWDMKGQLTLHGEPIAGSNVKVLLQGHVSRAKGKKLQATKDVGYDFFIHQLATQPATPQATRALPTAASSAPSEDEESSNWLSFPE